MISFALWNDSLEGRHALIGLHGRVLLSVRAECYPAAVVPRRLKLRHGSPHRLIIARACMAPMRLNDSIPV